jgi:hypothetical protein
MSVQKNFRAEDMLGAAKATETVVKTKVDSTPKAKTVKVEPVVVEKAVVDAPVDVVVEEVSDPVED